LRERTIMLVIAPNAIAARAAQRAGGMDRRSSEGMVGESRSGESAAKAS